MRLLPPLCLLLPLATAAHEAHVPTLTPGAYTCRVSSEYKPRPCAVELRDGKPTLVAKEAGLFGFEGTLEVQSPFTLVKARHTDRRPFGCFACAERCAESPASCKCKELPPAASQECLVQPLHVVLRPSGHGTWTGAVVVQRYTHALADGAPTGGFQREPRVIEVTVQKKR